MPIARSSRRLALLSLASLGLAPGACAMLKGAMAQAPTVVPRSWQVETVLVEPGNAELGSPHVFLDGAGQPAIALGDRAFYMGTQSVALGRRAADGWRVSFPLTPSDWRVCGRAGSGDAVVLTHGDLEGPLKAVAWDGTAATPAEAGPCPSATAPVRELAGERETIERSGDGRTLWHRVEQGKGCGPHDAEPGHAFAHFAAALDAQGLPQLVVFEQPKAGTPGRLRHVTCRDGAWTSSVVADGVEVTGVGLAVGPAGHPHVGYVVHADDRLRLTYAVPSEAGLAPLPSAAPDARVLPAVEACLRVHAQPLAGTGVERYQQGDGFRCGVLERDPEPPRQALAELTTRCDAGEATACAVAASLHHWLMGRVDVVLQLPQPGAAPLTTEWTGLRPAGVPEDRARAAALYHRACEGGDLPSCLHAAVLLPVDDPRRLDGSRRACLEAKLPDACALAVAQSGMKPSEPLAGRAEAVLRQACDGGDDPSACASLGVVLLGRDDEAGARVPLRRACDAGITSACGGSSQPK